MCNKEISFIEDLIMKYSMKYDNRFPELFLDKGVYPRVWTQFLRNEGIDQRARVIETNISVYGIDNLDYNLYRVYTCKAKRFANFYVSINHNFDLDCDDYKKDVALWAKFIYINYQTEFNDFIAGLFYERNIKY